MHRQPLWDMDTSLDWLVSADWRSACLKSKAVIGWLQQIHACQDSDSQWSGAAGSDPESGSDTYRTGISDSCFVFTALGRLFVIALLLLCAVVFLLGAFLCFRFWRFTGDGFWFFSPSLLSCLIFPESRALTSCRLIFSEPRRGRRWRPVEPVYEIFNASRACQTGIRRSAVSCYWLSRSGSSSSSTRAPRFGRSFLSVLHCVWRRAPSLSSFPRNTSLSTHTRLHLLLWRNSLRFTH